MNFNQLHYFVETMRCSSINKAARRLDINPSTLLAALNSLEDELGCPLLVRSKQGVQGTEAGQALFRDGLRVLDLKDSWMFLKYNKSLRKQLDVMAIPTLYHSILSDIVCKITDSDKDFGQRIK